MGFPVTNEIPCSQPANGAAQKFCAPGADMYAVLRWESATGAVHDGAADGNFDRPAGNCGLHNEGFRKVVSDAGKVLEKGLEFAKRAFCDTLGVGICPIVDLVVALPDEMKAPENRNDLGRALGSLFKKFKIKVENAGKDAEKTMKGLFASLKDMLRIRHEKDFPGEAWKFALKVLTSVDSLTTTFTGLIVCRRSWGKFLGSSMASPSPPRLRPRSSGSRSSTWGRAGSSSGYCRS
jgi:hypothetical protein